MSSEIRALVGRGTRFEGRLVFEQRARIEGALRGEVWGEGILVLGEGADVDATIEVGTLIVRAGTLRGEVQARELIEVHPDAKVYANITAPVIDLAKGCVFEGRCTMSSVAGTPAPEPSRS
ncbi:MAG: polymer-forming cytoskeletal protein [Sandaracinaceae bacterium]|nr:polymer-forming cytoskeletal protein [Sandaracinaceae bacterium]